MEMVDDDWDKVWYCDLNKSPLVLMKVRRRTAAAAHLEPVRPALLRGHVFGRHQAKVELKERNQTLSHPRLLCRSSILPTRTPFLHTCPIRHHSEPLTYLSVFSHGNGWPGAYGRKFTSRYTFIGLWVCSPSPKNVLLTHNTTTVF